MQLLLVLVLVVAVGAVSFAMQNNTVVMLKLMLWNFEASLALVVLISFGLGVITALLASFPGSIRKNMLISKLKNELPMDVLEKDENEDETVYK